MNINVRQSSRYNKKNTILLCFQDVKFSLTNRRLCDNYITFASLIPASTHEYVTSSSSIAFTLKRNLPYAIVHGFSNRDLTRKLLSVIILKGNTLFSNVFHFCVKRFSTQPWIFQQGSLLRRLKIGYKKMYRI